MNDETNNTERQLSPVALFKRDLVKRRDRFKEQLPPDINPERFISAAMSAVQHNPDLLGADTNSLFNALNFSCRDGLLPDNREGALVIHSTNIAPKGQPKNYVNKVAWMPMVKGVLKKLRQCSLVKTITLQVVYQGEDFEFWIDDDGEHLKHRPDFECDRSDQNIRLAYAMVRLEDGEIQTEIIAKGELEKIRQASKTGAKGYGPWKDWKAQMCKKAALHRLAPKLPLPNDIVDMIERDNELYDYEQRTEKDVTPAKPKKGKSSRLSHIVGNNEEPQDDEQDNTTTQPDAQ